jgi:hypothetical protein
MALGRNSRGGGRAANVPSAGPDHPLSAPRRPSGCLTWAAMPERGLEGHGLLALVILRMVLNDRLPKALANRDVIEPLGVGSARSHWRKPPQPASVTWRGL